MTKKEFSVILVKIVRFYPRFYDGQDPETVNNDWFEVGGFESIPFEVVDRAVKAYCNTSKFPPSLADIKSQMVESYLQDKPTAMQAFQQIARAVRKSYSKEDAVKQYNELPPILRKLVEEPSVLQDWNKVSTESFQTVVMSAIRESYRELATREAKYYAFPDELQMAEQWRVSTPDVVALPEPVKQKTIDEMQSDMDKHAAEYRESHGITANPKYDGRVAEFQAPMTKNELLMHEAKEKAKLKAKLERMRP